LAPVTRRACLDKKRRFVNAEFPQEAIIPVPKTDGN